MNSDCCAPLSLEEEASCSHGYVPVRNGNGCFGYDGAFTCCSHGMPPSPPTPPSPPPPPDSMQLSAATCERLLQQKTHLFLRMWGVESRHQNHKGDVACWSRDRALSWKEQDGEAYFHDLLRGTHCLSTNWYEGAPNNHGKFRQADAPALLGFDDNINQFCNYNCDQKGFNILNLFGGIKYNQCRNFEWQMCAAKGFLNKQASRKIVFAHAPKNVWMDGWPPFDQCSGYTGEECNRWLGFANDDIYPLEVCLYSQVCKNDDELFNIEAGDPFVCDIDVPGFHHLQSMLMDGPSI